MKQKHRNIPIFIPHMGCPNQCVFCNQRSISGCLQFCEADVKETIERALETLSEETEAEIAFFGGSFTGIERDLMVRLLELAERYVTAGRVSSIRLSTRPDYISEEILRILSSYSVRHIELGLQSMDDAVLAAAHRGHTVAQAEAACYAVKAAGFALVGQMMIGLPGATPESEIRTAEKICEMGADGARIYPTVVFYDTPLCEMLRRGEYEPLSVSSAVTRSANALEVFRAHRVPCIRIGLCASEDLVSAEKVAAGPNHPALGELVMGECSYRTIVKKLKEAHLLGERVALTVPKGEASRTVGQHRSNLTRLFSETGTRVCKTLEDASAEEIGVRLYP